MWQFLTALIPYLQNVSWKNVIHNIAMIPKWLRRLLIFIVILGAVYFGYGKFFQERIVVELLEQVKILSNEVNGVITVADYNVDISYIIDLIYIIEELDDYSYHTAVLNNKILKSILLEHYEDDPSLKMLDKNLETMELLRNELKNNIHTILYKIDPEADKKLKKATEED